MLRLTILVDNTTRRTDLQAEHGFAVWVETPTQRVLFDTGAGAALAANATALGIRLEQADAIALSHGHYDHTGGLPAAWAEPARMPLYLHPGALTARYRVDAHGTKPIGMPPAVRELLARHPTAMHYTHRPTMIAPGVWLTGHVPRRQDLAEIPPEPFFLDPAGHEDDPLIDDQALYVETPAGVVVVLGCTHAGVRNTLLRIRNLTHQAPLRAVIGGMHLRSADAPSLAATVTALRDLAPGLVVPAHCTGAAAMASLAAAFGDRFEPGGAGAVFTFPEASTASTQESAMIIAIPVANGKLCNHFGHCEQFALVTADPATKKLQATRLLTPPPHEPGVLPKWLHEQGANVILAGGMGQRAQQLFAQSGVTVVVGAPVNTPERLAAAYLAGTLQAGANVCDH